MPLLIHMVLSLCVIVFQLPFAALALDKPWLIPKEARFRPDGRVEIDQYEQKEIGMYNGIRYRFFFSDGSGSFAGTPGNTSDVRERKNDWHVGCKKDPINDYKSCHMIFNTLSIFVHDNGTASVLIGSRHYPGSTTAIRINDEKPFISNEKAIFDPQTSVRIIERLKTNPKVTTRYQELGRLNRTLTVDQFLDSGSRNHVSFAL